MRRHPWSFATLTLVALLSAGFPARGAAHPAGADDLVWYYDAETALEVAKESERPIVVLKVRADIGKDVKT